MRFVACCVFVVHGVSLVFVVRCSLFVCCSLCVVCCCLPVVRCMLLIACCSLVVRCLQLVRCAVALCVVALRVFRFPLLVA